MVPGVDCDSTSSGVSLWYLSFLGFPRTSDVFQTELRKSSLPKDSRFKIEPACSHWIEGPPK